MRNLAAVAPGQRWRVRWAEGGQICGMQDKRKMWVLHSKMFSKFKWKPQSTNQVRPSCREVCRQDRLEFESKSAAPRNGILGGSHGTCASLSHLYARPGEDMSVLESPPVVLVLLPDRCFHVPTQGEIYPIAMISQVHSTMSTEQ